MNVGTYIVLEIRAMGPCSFEHLRRWLLDQCPEINANNVDAKLQRFLNAMLLLGVLIEDYDETDMVFEFNYESDFLERCSDGLNFTQAIADARRADRFVESNANACQISGCEGHRPKGGA